jgi:hypothetical protein
VPVPLSEQPDERSRNEDHPPLAIRTSSGHFARPESFGILERPLPRDGEQAGRRARAAALRHDLRSRRHASFLAFVALQRVCRLAYSRRNVARIRDAVAIRCRREQRIFGGDRGL